MPRVLKDHDHDWPTPVDPEDDGKRELNFMLVITVMVFALIGLSIYTDEAEATPWQYGKATWYGPGFYGNTTACGQHYSRYIRGAAVNTGRCGDRYTICRSTRCVRVVKIDTGGFGHKFDLSARTAMDLCRCWRPYTMGVRWSRGWFY